MKLIKVTTVLVALAGCVLLAQGAPSDASQAPAERRAHDLLVLGGRGAEIGVSIADGAREGVVVEEVRPDSPAEKAGLKRSDLIVEFDGEHLRSARQFSRL